MRSTDMLRLAFLLGCVTGASGAIPDEEAAATRPASVAADEAGWSDTLNGVRVRLTAPGGAAVRDNAWLRLSVEVQNNTDRPIPCRELWQTVRITVQDGEGRWLGVPWLGPQLGEWASRPGDLQPRQVLKLHLPFQALRFNRQLKAGETVELRATAPTQQARDGQLPHEVRTPALTLKVETDFPQPLKESEVAGDWNLELACRIDAGLLGNENVEVDADGNATLVQNTQRDGKRVEGRRSIKLSPQRLTRLVADLRKAAAWKLVPSNEHIPFPDEGFLRLALVAPTGGSVSGDFPSHREKDEPAILGVRQVVQELAREIENATKAGDASK